MLTTTIIQGTKRIRPPLIFPCNTGNPMNTKKTMEYMTEAFEYHEIMRTPRSTNGNAALLRDL